MKDMLIECWLDGFVKSGQLWKIEITSSRSGFIQLSREKPQHVGQVSFPVRPTVATGKLIVHIWDPGHFEFAAQVTIVLEQRILGSAVKAQRWQTVTISHQSFKH
jgi:hypothetical protein